MFIVQCTPLIVAIWSSTVVVSIQNWDRNFGSEIHLLKNRKTAMYDPRTQRLVDAIKQKSEFNERLLILFCSRRCYPTQSQVILISSLLISECYC